MSPNRNNVTFALPDSANDLPGFGFQHTNSNVFGHILPLDKVVLFETTLRQLHIPVKLFYIQSEVACIPALYLLRQNAQVYRSAWSAYLLRQQDGKVEMPQCPFCSLSDRRRVCLSHFCCALRG